MLLNTLYTYEHLEGEALASLKFRVNTQANHEIYNGHFPDNPITPGVCQMQMVKEILSDHLGQNLFFNSVSDMKFISMWVPNESEAVFMDISAKDFEEGYKIKASIYTDSCVYFKLRGKADVCK